MQEYKLNTGKKVPAVGFGTWQITPDSEAKSAVLAAIQSGYRLIDTARIYGNEVGVGEALRESGHPRQELFVTSKVWNDDQAYDRTLKACQASLERLGLDYLDLYLIHWPATSKRHESWRAMEQLLSEGLIKAAGVSNFTIEHLEELKQKSHLVPVINQVEFHPFIYSQQRELLEYCKQNNILMEAYSPLSRVSSDANPVIEEIAANLSRTSQQVVLRWCIQHGTLPLPRSTNPAHIHSNFQVFDFELSDADMQQLNSISDGDRVTWDPEGMG